MENKLKFLLLFWVVLPVFLKINVSHAQELYKEIISNERDRRQIYRLNDWIGYINMRHITWIASDNRYVYFATNGGGIWRYNKIKETWEYPFTSCNGLPDNRILMVYYDRGQNILIAITPEDTAVFDYGQQIWLSKNRDGALPYQINIPVENGQTSDDILVFKKGYQEDFGMLSFTDASYNYLLGGRVQDKDFREYSITGYFKDDYNHIFFAIEELGLAMGYFTDNDFDIIEGGISEISPRAFFFTSNEIWIGGIGLNPKIEGITRWYNDNRFSIYNYRYIPEMISDNVFYISATDSLTAFATDIGVTLYLNNKDQWETYTQSSGLMSDRTLSLGFDKRGLWIGTQRGLNFMDLRTREIYKWQREIFRNQRIYDFYKADSVHLMGTSLGVFRKFSNEDEWQGLDLNLPFPEIEITAIAQRKNILWVAGAYGIARINLKNHEIEYFREISQQVSPVYHDIIFYENGVFIGTDNGLLRYDKKNNKWQLYTTRDGLLDNRVFQLYTENGDLWLVTAVGICQFRYRRTLH
jgi:hypothetical protein